MLAIRNINNWDSKSSIALIGSLVILIKSINNLIILYSIVWHLPFVIRIQTVNKNCITINPILNKYWLNPILIDSMTNSMDFL